MANRDCFFFPLSLLENVFSYYFSTQNLPSVFNFFLIDHFLVSVVISNMFGIISIATATDSSVRSASRGLARAYSMHMWPAVVHISSSSILSRFVFGLMQRIIVIICIHVAGCLTVFLMVSLKSSKGLLHHARYVKYHCENMDIGAEVVVLTSVDEDRRFFSPIGFIFFFCFYKVVSLPMRETWRPCLHGTGQVK